MKPFVIGILVVVIGGCAACGGIFMLALLAKPTPGTSSASATQSAPPAPAVPEVSISAADLYAAYKTNEIAADGLYRNKILSVSGEVATVTRDAFDNTIVELKAHRVYGTVRATLADGQNSRAATLAPGQSIVIVGKCTGMMIGDPQIDEAVVR